MLSNGNVNIVIEEILCFSPVCPRYFRFYKIVCLWVYNLQIWCVHTYDSYIRYNFSHIFFINTNTKRENENESELENSTIHITFSVILKLPSRNMANASKNVVIDAPYLTSVNHNERGGKKLKDRLLPLPLGIIIMMNMTSKVRHTHFSIIGGYYGLILSMLISVH